MAREKICGIYKIENLVNGKVYIGSSKDIYKRWVDHLRDLNNNKHHSYKLQRSWNKHGKENFEFIIIEEFYCDKKELYKLEQYYLDLYKSYDYKYGYNVNENANYPTIKPTEYEDIVNGKFIISKEQFDEMIYYLCNTKISIPKISKMVGIKERSIYQIYFKDNYTEIVKDLNFIQRKVNGEDNWNSIFTENQVLEIISNLLNREFMIDISRKYRVNTSTIWDIYNHKTWVHLTENIIFPKYQKASGRTAKPIFQYDIEGNFITTYKSAREAEEKTGIGYKMISRVCKGKRPHTHGYVFKFVS